MAFVGRTTATRGALIRLRDILEFIQNGKDILKMKRDRLAGELNTHLNELSRRGELEKRLLEIYDEFKATVTAQGYATISSTASSISKMSVDTLPTSIMGVLVPKIVVKEKPQMASVKDLSLHEVAEKLQNSIDELLAVAQIETTIERIAYELMMINRKVNALEKVIIPAYMDQIRYIEDSLFDEDLEEFARIKHFRDVAGRKQK
jgi:V/A-type H+-transporting ATPase subunit D